MPLPMPTAEGGTMFAFGCGGGGDYGQCTIPGDLLGIPLLGGGMAMVAPYDHCLHIGAVLTGLQLPLMQHCGHVMRHI